MAQIPISTVSEGEEFATNCDCCGRPIYWGMGWLESESRTLAAYWYQWSEGHQGLFRLAVARFDDEENLVAGVAQISGQVDSKDIRYSILDADDYPWDDFGSFGPVISRAQALEHEGWIFNLVDAIAANERRLSSRILECGLHT
jgi:hypothetical protein